MNAGDEDGVETVTDDAPFQAALVEGVDAELAVHAPLEVRTAGGLTVRVKSAEFVTSSVSVSQCPPATHPEFAVIGRSNVGKSSLINLLTGRKSLALVSKTPGS